MLCRNLSNRKDATGFAVGVPDTCALAKASGSCDLPFGALAVQRAQRSARILPQVRFVLAPVCDR